MPPTLALRGKEAVDGGGSNLKTKLSHWSITASQSIFQFTARQSGKGFYAMFENYYAYSFQQRKIM